MLFILQILLLVGGATFLAKGEIQASKTRKITGKSARTIGSIYIAIGVISFLYPGIWILIPAFVTAAIGFATAKKV